MEFFKNKNLSPLNLIPFNFSFSQQQQTVNESPPSFKPGVICDRFAKFSEYRNNYQNRFFHFIDRKLFNDTYKLLDNSKIFNEKPKHNHEEKKELLLSSTNIELSALKDKKNNFMELFYKTEKVLKELAGISKGFRIIKKKAWRTIKN